MPVRVGVCTHGCTCVCACVVGEGEKEKKMEAKEEKNEEERRKASLHLMVGYYSHSSFLSFLLLFFSFHSGPKRFGLLFFPSSSSSSFSYSFSSFRRPSRITRGSTPKDVSQRILTKFKHSVPRFPFFFFFFILSHDWSKVHDMVYIKATHRGKTFSAVALYVVLSLPPLTLFVICS